MKLFFVSCLLFVSVGVMVSFGGREKTELLHGYLSRMGTKLDCYFTIESVSAEGVDDNPISHAWIKPDHEPKDIQDLINVITNAMASARLPAENLPRIELDFIQTDKMPVIIHIVDRRLQKKLKYALNIDVSVTYDGTPEGLIEYLSKIIPSVQQRNGCGVGGDPLVSDYGTKINVTANQQTVRNILTNYIPLTNYNHVIWSSGTVFTGGSPSTKIWFHGPDARK